MISNVRCKIILLCWLFLLFSFPFSQIPLMVISGSIATTQNPPKVCMYTKKLFRGEITFRGLYERMTREHKDLCDLVMKKIAEVSFSLLLQWSNNMRQAGPARKLALTAMITLKGHHAVIRPALILLATDEIYNTIPTNEGGFCEIHHGGWSRFAHKLGSLDLLDLFDLWHNGRKLIVLMACLFLVLA